MGLITNKVDFSQEDIKNRDLILNMLAYEDTLYLSNDGQHILQNYGKNFTSLEGSKIIQKMTLDKFNFIPSENSLKNYRKIFAYYYKSSLEYDKEVLQSVYYMRENRCLYYTTPELNIGDKVPDVNLYALDGLTKKSLYNILDGKKFDNCIIAAFSLS